MLLIFPSEPILEIRSKPKTKITFYWDSEFQKFQNEDYRDQNPQLLDFAIARLDPTNFREK